MPARATAATTSSSSGTWCPRSLPSRARSPAAASEILNLQLPLVGSSPRWLRAVLSAHCRRESAAHLQPSGVPALPSQEKRAT